MSPLVLYVFAGACVAGFVQGLSGFGFGMVAIAFWAWSVDPTLVGPMIVFGSLVGQSWSLGTIRQNIRADYIAPFAIGGIFGVPLGVLVLSHLDLLTFRICVGILLISYCSFTLLSGRVQKIHRGGRAADAGIGFISGVMGGIGGLVGPAVLLWCTLRGWEKDRQRAIFQPFFLLMHVLTLVAYVMSGLVTFETVKMFAIVGPSMLIPAWLGARMYKKLDDSGFRRLILGLLLLSGIALVALSIPLPIRQ